MENPRIDDFINFIWTNVSVSQLMIWSGGADPRRATKPFGQAGGWEQERANSPQTASSKQLSV